MPGWFDTLRSWLWPMAPGTQAPGTNPFPIASDPAVSDPWGSDAYRDGQWSPVIAPVASNPEADQIRADAYVPPYSGPLDLDDHGRETAEMRRAYRDFHRSEPAIRSAIDGKAAAVAALDVSVLPEDKDSPADRAAAEFVDWTVRRSRDGWDGLILTILRPALIDGFSIAEKVLRGIDDSPRWRGFHGLRHVKGRDTQHLMLRLDAYRNILGVVSTVRGLRTFDPGKVILFTHAELFDSPFGQSDLRAAYRSAGLIADAYKLWHIALKLYSQPYAHGKVTHPGSRPQMEAALKSLRASGWAVTPKDDEIALLNLASATGYDAFERKVRILREDIFLAVRGAYTPFMQSNAGAGETRGDTAISQGVGSDPVEELLARAVGRCLTRELVPDLVRTNFGPGVGLPSVVLGGVNWGALKDRLDIIERAKGLKLSVSAKWAHDILQIPPATDPDDELGGTTAPDSDPPGGGPAPAGSGPAPDNDTSPNDDGGNPPSDTPSDGFPELIRAMLQAKADGDEEAVARLGELARDPQKLAATVVELRAKGEWGEDEEEGPRTFSAWPTVWMAHWHEDATDRSKERITNDQNSKEHEYGKTAEETLKAQENREKRGATDPAQGGTTAPAQGTQPKPKPPAATGGTATPKAKKGGKKSGPETPSLFDLLKDHPPESLAPPEKGEVAAHIGAMTSGQAKDTLGAATPDATKEKRAKKLLAAVDKKTAAGTTTPAAGATTPSAPAAKSTATTGAGAAAGSPPTGGPPRGQAAAAGPGQTRPSVLGSVDDMKRMSDGERRRLIVEQLLPKDWQPQPGKRDRRQGKGNRIKNHMEHLNNLDNKDLYAILHHYANAEQGKEFHSWAHKANEILLNRAMSDAGFEHSPQAGIDAYNNHAIVNYKLMTDKADPQDNFKSEHIPRISSILQTDQHRGKAFTRVALNLQPGREDVNGLHIYPGYGEGNYTGKTDNLGGQRRLAPLKDVEQWIDGKAPGFTGKVAKDFNNTDWKEVNKDMDARSDKRHDTIAKELLKDNPAAIYRNVGNMDRSQYGVVLAHMTNQLPVGHKEDTVTHLADSLPAESQKRIYASISTKLRPEDQHAMAVDALRSALPPELVAQMEAALRSKKKEN